MKIGDLIIQYLKTHRRANIRTLAAKLGQRSINVRKALYRLEDKEIIKTYKPARDYYVVLTPKYYKENVWEKANET